METTSFEYGCSEGKKLLRLVERIYIKWEEHSRYTETIFGCPPESLKPLWGQFKDFHERPEITGFLSVISPHTELDAGIVSLMPLQELIEYQSNSAPLCEIPRSFGFLGFATWCGRSDGDAWVVNLRSGELLSIDVGCGSSDLQEVMHGIYAQSSNLAQWRKGLIAEAIERGWVLPAEMDDLT